jgi:hypothetical protein
MAGKQLKHLRFANEALVNKAKIIGLSAIVSLFMAGVVSAAVTHLAG